MSSDDETERTLPAAEPAPSPAGEPSPVPRSAPSPTQTIAPTLSQAEENDPLVGTEFVGKYRINKVLGRGGMGAVYLAEHLLMRRQVAIKVLLTRMLDDDSSRKRFEHEARIASQLSHPSAVTLYDFGIEADLPYLVMEYVEGSTLKSLLKAEGALSIERTVGLLSQLEGALSQAHRMGIVHRDLKPDNIILTHSDTGEEVAKILDFGISKAIGMPGVEALEETDLTQTGMVIGTPRYLSPEQARGEKIDQRTDIYSLGIMTYEMLSGSAPFSQGTVLEVIAQHLHTEPPKLSDVMKSISPEVTAVVAAALSKSPEDRPPTVAAYVEGLRKASTRKGRRALLAAVALLVLGGLVFVFRDSFLTVENEVAQTLPVVIEDVAEDVVQRVEESREAAPQSNEEAKVTTPESTEEPGVGASVEAEKEKIAVEKAKLEVEEEKVAVAKAKQEAAQESLKLEQEKEKLLEAEAASSVADKQQQAAPSPSPSPAATAAAKTVVASKSSQEKAQSPSVPSGYYIELKAVKTKAEAEALVRLFRGTKYRAYFEETTSLGKRRYQVYIGRFESMFAAMGDAKAVAKISGISSKVTTVKQK